jgi:Uroporphyrinogen decarboxylase (URO-D)
MTSRQRMLAALNGQEPDHLPCSFMLYNGLKSTCRDYLEFIQKQLDLGLDPYVQIPPRPPVVANDYYNLHGLPVSYHPSVVVRGWKENLPGVDTPILVKEYHTPAGTLRAEVRQTSDWRWGDHVPFLDDYIVPRSRKFLIEQEEDLENLAYLLVEPTPAEIAAFHSSSQPVLDFARAHDLLVAGGWGVGVDLVAWIFGLENMVYALHDQPAFIRHLLDQIAAWNRRRMEVILEAGVDLYIKRAWYENCDFWSPAKYRQFVAPILQADVDLAHAHGAKFGYIISSNCMPLLGDIRDAGVDVILGVDLHCWDLEVARARTGGKVALWGGVNGHLTVENGSPDQVRAEVRRAAEILAPGGRFILSPVDNVREENEVSRQNVTVLIDEWKRLSC